MNILFANPYIFDFTAYDLWLRPLGLLYLASVVKQFTDCEVHWIDALDRFQAANHPDQKSVDPQNTRPGIQKHDGRGKFHREIVAKPGIYRQVPRYYSRYGLPVEAFKHRLQQLPEIDLIFMTSLMTYWVEGIRFTIDCLRERFPRAEVVLGGVLPTLFSRFAKQHIPVDHIIRGPGESRILEFLKTRRTKVRKHPDFTDIDSIPFPANEFLSNPKILPLMTSRGCPYTCAYCASRILNPAFRERSPGSVREEITAMADQYHTEHFVIFDDALLINQDRRFHRIFDGIESISPACFHTPNGLHAREIRADTSERLFQSGFKTIRLGFESIKPEILSISSHKVNREDMARAVSNLEKAGYRKGEIEVYILFGMVNQSRKDMEDTLFFVRDLGVIPRLSYFSPVPGTRLFRYLQKKGILSTPANLLETNKTYFVYQKSGLSPEDIQSVKELTDRITTQNKKN